MHTTIHSTVTVKKGTGDTAGNPSAEITFAGVTAEVYDKAKLTDEELYMYKLGVLACREHIYDRLADLLDSDSERIILEKIDRVLFS